MSDYDELMILRIAGIQKHDLTLSKIREIIASNIRPFEGALDFLRSLRSVAEVIILSDTFIEFFKVLRSMLECPVILCNALEVENDIIQKHRMRMKHGKQDTVRVFKDLQCTVVLVGDS